jgi:hypothetical protein
MKWNALDSRVHVILEKFEHPIRTVRLAYGRNLLLQVIHNRVTQLNDQRKIYLISMDFDDVNTSPFQLEAFENAFRNQIFWDAISFNRKFYYDIWSLRYERFDVNVWNFGSHSKTLRDLITADIVTMLDTKNDSHLYPVLSAFNGFAIYKYQVVDSCYYNGTNEEVFAPYTSYNISRKSIYEDCEHVAFHKCMIRKNNARIRISSKYLVENHSMGSKE